MTNKKILLACIVSTALVACSSDRSTIPSDTNQSAPATPTTPTTPASASTEQGVILDKGGSFVPYSNGGSEDLNTITLEGVDVTLVPNGIFSVGFTTINDRVVSGTKYADSKFGFVKENGNWGMFSHGNLTKIMPTSGVANYSGDAIGIIEGSTDIFTGNSTAVVNFNEKSIDGVLNNWSGQAMPAIDFKGKITGNNFSGDSVQGRFYGENATEIGGVVKSDKAGHAMSVTFGGIRK